MTPEPPAKPKIIQIAINPEGDTSYACLYALRDDGTIWNLSLTVPADKAELLKVWSQLPAIP